VVAGALEGDSVLKFWAIRCDFAMTLVERSLGETSFAVSAKKASHSLKWSGAMRRFGGKPIGECLPIPSHL
jgi:hypothetical protein